MRQLIIVLCLFVGSCVNEGSYPTSGDISKLLQCDTAPEAWWKLDESSGTTALDSTSGGNYGTHVNSPTPVSGVVGNGFSFDGVNDYVEVPSAAELNVGAGDFSISYYIQTVSTQLDVIVDKRVESSGSVRGYVAYISGGRPAIQIANGSGWTNYDSGVYFADGQWHHVVISVDRDNPNGGNFYLDGSLVTTFNPTGRQGDLSTAKPLHIGRRSDSSPGYFSGSLDEVKLYKEALSEADLNSCVSTCHTGSVGDSSYCSEQCPCEEGEGDCDGETEECAPGLTCVHNVGANYGWDPDVDVCEATCHSSELGTSSYCSETCLCEEGEGDCDGDTEQCAPGLTCVHNVGANYGWDPDIDVCEATCHSSALGTSGYCSETCLCEEGEGDCDGDTEQCAPGLTCVHNVGANYGWDPDIDVCEAIGGSSPVSGVSYNDTLADDAAPTLIHDFFSSLVVDSSDYIYLSINTNGTPGSGGAWCSERADWYVSQYLLHAGTGHIGQSGAWTRWHRSESGAWSGPSNQSRNNYFGVYCGGVTYDWCTEWGLGGLWLAVMPGRTDTPHLGESYAFGWSQGRSWDISIQVGRTRLDTCGF